MKQLICERDICDLSKRGVKQIAIGANTMITSAAEDAALSLGIEVVRTCDASIQAKLDALGAATISADTTEAPENTEIDPELVYRVVTIMAKHGFLKDIVASDESGHSCSTCNCAGH